MTPADRNELIDRATRLMNLADPLVFLAARNAFEDHLIAKVNIADLIAIRDMDQPTIGTRMIAGIMSSWNV